MGLDITAYRKLTSTTASQEEIENGTVFSISDAGLDYAEKNFPGRAEGLKPGYYAFEKAFRFRAGSYTGYGEWRSKLAEMVYGVPAKTLWREKRTEGPFIELINFFDNEGIIGPKVAAKLVLDFAQWQDKVPAKDPDGFSWFAELYAKWRLAFEMASDGGAVDFH